MIIYILFDYLIILIFNFIDLFCICAIVGRATLCYVWCCSFDYLVFWKFGLSHEVFEPLERLGSCLGRLELIWNSWALFLDLSMKIGAFYVSFKREYLASGR